MYLSRLFDIDYVFVVDVFDIDYVFGLTITKLSTFGIR